MLCRGKRNCNQRISFQLGTFLRASFIVTDWLRWPGRWIPQGKLTWKPNPIMSVLWAYMPINANYNQRIRDVTGSRDSVTSVFRIISWQLPWKGLAEQQEPHNSDCKAWGAPQRIQLVLSNSSTFRTLSPRRVIPQSKLCLFPRLDTRQSKEYS